MTGASFCAQELHCFTKIFDSLFNIQICTNLDIEDLADQLHLPTDEHEPIEMYHQLI